MDKPLPFEEARDLSNLEGILFTFFTERGKQVITYEEYLSDLPLRVMMNTQSRYKLVLGRLLFSYDMKYLKQKPQIAAHLRNLEHEKAVNPLRFFAPSGKQSLDYINDFDNDLCILTACNRFGKTQNTMIKKLINTIPCDPEWEIFKLHGVKHREWLGPKTLGFASYELASHKSTLLPMLLNWAPKEELGPYAKDYKGKGAKRLNLNSNQDLELTSGTLVGFYTTTQGQSRFESSLNEDWLWDEQGEEAKFDGADERTRTTPSGGRHDFGMTPHKVDGRPDTGAGSWINAIADGSVTKGHSISMYHGQVWDVPDWIYPEKSKAKAYYKWVTEPYNNQNDKARREGLSRFFGMWHESSGLVIDEWDSSVHVIEPFEIPRNWTLYRAYDHGIKHPAACLWGAVSPMGDLVIYRDYLQKGLVPTQNAKNIIELSGNKRKLIGTYRSPKTELQYDKYKEVMSKEHYQFTVMDSRAYSSDSAGEGIKLNKIYSMAGLHTKKASGSASEHYVPILKEWFQKDETRPHLITKELGAPRIYIFSNCNETIKCIKGWVWKERKTRSSEAKAKESPRDIDDDLCDCLKYLIQANPKFRGNPLMSDRKFYEEDELDGGNVIVNGKRTNEVVDPISGY